MLEMYRFSKGNYKIYPKIRFIDRTLTIPHISNSMEDNDMIISSSKKVLK